MTNGPPIAYPVKRESAMDQLSRPWKPYPDQRKQSYDSNIFELKNQDLPIKYPRPIKLNIMNLEDLQALLLYIPPHHKAFLQDLISEQQGQGNLYDQDDHYSDDDMRALLLDDQNY